MSERLSSVDVLIIGNGALGMFLADELADRQIGSVAVVGPSAREAGASQAAGAMLGCFGEVTPETLRTEAGRTRFELGVAAHDRWPDVLRRLEETSPTGRPLQVATDTHVILNTIGAELDSVNFVAMLAALKEYDQPWEEVDPNSIPGYKPRLDCRALRAIHLPAEGAIDARGVLAAVELRIRKAGVHIVEQTVSKLLSGNGAVTGVELDDGRLIEAGTVVVAAGARSEALVRTAFDEFDMMPTFPGLGFAMIARRVKGEPFQSVVRTPNRGFACGLHIVPAGDGREYIGATNRVVDDISSVAVLGDTRSLPQYAMQQLDEQIGGHLVEQWLRGNRPVTLDGLPLIGPLPLPGLYLMTGTYRDGFHCAPVLAAHVANELQGIPGIIDEMFKPMRKPVATRTIEGSIDEFIQHILATWYENSSEAPPMMTAGRIAETFRVEALRTYEQLEVDYALGPDMLYYASGSPIGARRIARYLNGPGKATA